MSKKNNQTPYNAANEFRYSKQYNNTTNEYIQNRLIAQIRWYSAKSRKEQKHYKQLSVVSIIVTAIIPIFTLLLDFDCINTFAKIVIAVLSSCASVITGINTLYKHKELWVQYRTNCELLKSVLHRFYTQSDEFNGKTEEEAFKILVSSCEQYFVKEFDNWNNIYSSAGSSTSS